jgi:hypothetical protein
MGGISLQEANEDASFLLMEIPILVLLWLKL